MRERRTEGRGPAVAGTVRTAASPAPDRCPLALWVLVRLPDRPGTMADAEVRAHLVECPACRGLVAAHFAALEPPAPVVAPLVPPAGPAAPRRRRWASAVLVGGVAAALLVSLQIRERARSPLLAAVVPGPPCESSAEPARPGDRQWLRVTLGEPAYVYSAIAWTLGLGWEEAAPPSEGRTARSEPGSPIDLFLLVPQGAIEAGIAVLASPRELERDEIERLKAALRQAVALGARDSLQALADAVGGEFWSRRVAPDASGDEDPSWHPVEAALEDPDPAGALRDWVARAGDAAEAETARRLEAQLRLEAREPGTADLGVPREIARAVEAVRGDRTLLDRVEAYARWCASPDDLRKKLELDRRILREVLPHDDSNAVFQRVRATLEESALVYAGAARDYESLGDPWGRAEAMIRQAYCEPAPRARRTFSAAGAISEESAYPRGAALAQYGLAYIHYYADAPSLLQVRSAFDDAAARLEGAGLWEGVAVAENDVAHECLKRGAVGEAFRRLTRAAACARRAGSARDEAVALGKLAWAHDLVGRSGTALDLALVAARTLEGIQGPTEGHVVQARNYASRLRARAALFAVHADLPAAADDQARRAALLAPEFDPDTRARAANALARAAVLSGDGAARRLAEEAVRAAEKVYAWRIGEALVTEGLACEQADDLVAAAAAFRRAAEVLGREELQDLFAIAEALDGLSRVEEALGDDAASLDSRRLSLAPLRAAVDDAELTASDRAQLRNRFRPGIEAGLRVASRIGPESGAGEALLLLEASRPAAIAQLRSRRGDAPVPRTAVSLPELCAALGEEEAWVEYFLGAETSCALVARRGGPSLVDLGLPGAELRSRGEALRRAAADGAPIDAVLRASRRAADGWLAPLDLGHCRTLLISPDPSTDAIPFEALLEADGSFLIERRSVAYVPSAGILRELRAAATAFPVRRQLDRLGATATGAPLRSVDAILDVEEVGGPPGSAPGALLAVAEPGAPFLPDLPAILLGKGAPSVLTRLWPVADEPASARLLETLRASLESGGIPAAESLRGAKLELLRGASASARHPRAWAGAILTGLPD